MNAAARDRLLFAAALVVGAVTWFGVAGISGRKEAWDAPEFAAYGLPFALGACFLLGFWGSRGAWRWPILVVGAILGCSAFTSGRGLGLWPLLLMLLLLLAATAMIPTYIGVGLRRLVDARRARRLAAAARQREFEIAARTKRDPAADSSGANLPGG